MYRQQQNTNELLFKAVSNNDVDTVRDILTNRRHEINLEYNESPDGDGDPLLTHALNFNHFAIAQLLIDAGADVNHGNDGSVREKFMVKDPIYCAIAAAALKPAVFDEAFQILTNLVERGADLNHQTPGNAHGRIPSLETLMFYWNEREPASQANCQRILRFLLDQGANPDIVREAYRDTLQQRIQAIRDLPNQARPASPPGAR